MLVSVTLTEEEQLFLLALGAVCGEDDAVPLSVSGKVTRARQDLWRKDGDGES